MPILVIRVTERCNSDCYYCNSSRKRGAVSMSSETVQRIFVLVNDYLSTHSDDHVELQWHGGEPLVMGPQFFRSVLEMQRKECPETLTRISHSIQSNLTCFSEKHANVFKQLGITVIGTSYDPEPNMRGPGGKINSILYQKKYLAALHLVEKYGFDWGIIYVVTRKSLRDPTGVFVFLTNLNLSGNLSFNPVLVDEGKGADIAITPPEFVDFLGAVFPHWWKNRARFPHVEPFGSLVDGIARVAEKGEIDNSFNNRLNDHINVAPNGETSQCRTRVDGHDYHYGNVKEQSLDGILRRIRSHLFRLITERKHTRNCGDCHFWDLCLGGYVMDSFSQNEKFAPGDEWCHARKQFLEEILEPTTGVRYGS